MSTLWDVSVIDKTEQYIDLQVTLSHPDAGPFPEDKTFAFLLLTNEAYGFDDNYEYIATSPLGEAIPHEKSYQPDDVESIVDEYVTKTIVCEAKNVPYEEDDVFSTITNKLIEQGIEEDSDEWDEAWDEENDKWWENPNNIPVAKYRIWVTAPKWIEHLKKGKTFDTAAYSNNGPWINEARNQDPSK